MSVLVVGEIRQGIERLRRHDPAQVAVLETWLDTIKRAYVDCLVPISVEVAEVWGRISSPAPLPLADGLMAATALVHDWTFATRNTRDVERTGVRLINPFEAS